MALPAAKPRYTIEEYLAKERDALDRHEYHDGEILAMSGGIVKHSRVGTNAIVALGAALRGKPCQPYGPDLRVSIQQSRRYVYPDVTVICGDPILDPKDDRGETIINPTVIVEVLSPSSERYDRTEKFDHYWQIPTLQEYVLISQTSARVESYVRRGAGPWLFNTFAGKDQVAQFASIEVNIPLAEIYSGVSFEPAPEIGEASA